MKQEPIHKFWLVWNINGRSPTFKHQSKASAQAEARRLARQCPDDLFVVLAAVDAYIAPTMDPQRVGLKKPANEPDDNIPF